MIRVPTNWSKSDSDWICVWEALAMIDPSLDRDYSIAWPPDGFAQVASDQLIGALASGKLVAWGEVADGTHREIGAVDWSILPLSPLKGSSPFAGYRLRREDVSTWLRSIPSIECAPAPRSEMEALARPILITIAEELPELSQRQCAMELAARYSRLPPPHPKLPTCVGYVRWYRHGR